MSCLSLVHPKHRRQDDRAEGRVRSAGDGVRAAKGSRQGSQDQDRRELAGYVSCYVASSTLSTVTASPPPSAGQLSGQRVVAARRLLLLGLQLHGQLEGRPHRLPQSRLRSRQRPQRVSPGNIDWVSCYLCCCCCYYIFT